MMRRRHFKTSNRNNDEAILASQAKFSFRCFWFWLFHMVFMSVTVWSLLSVLTPMPSFFLGIADILCTDGIGADGRRQIDQRISWLKRYVVGPPTDRDLIDFLNVHRSDLEELVELYYGQTPSNPDSPGKVQALEKALGVRIRSGGTRELKTSKRSFQHNGSRSAEIVPNDSELFWWKEADALLTKSLIYVPDIDTEREVHPAYRDHVILYLFGSSIIADNTEILIEHVRTGEPWTGSIVRQIDTHWFIRVREAGRKF